MMKPSEEKILKCKEVIEELENKLVLCASRNSKVILELHKEKKEDAKIIAGLTVRAGNAELRADELLKVVQLVYRKHCMGYEGIGWDELGGVLLDALCNTMGTEGYEEWKSSLKGGEK